MFRNEPLTNFARQAERDKFKEALQQIDADVGSGSLVAYPIVNGETVETPQVFKRADPADPSVAVGTVHWADADLARKAVNSLVEGKKLWPKTPAMERAACLQKAAALIRKQKTELAALMVREAGKPWQEADADVAEAIDFCEYYATQMLERAEPVPTSNIPGERNVYHYRPKGVAVVISPWNFPLAIPCGMWVAALVAGNTALLKPAEQTSLITYRLAKILLEAGVPGNTMAYLPGKGEALGPLLVEHPQVDVIAFTGSKQVGLDILRRASVPAPGQRHLKKVIAELGGKNAIIVDDDADVDEAIKGVVYSAFGYSGQKCSACSRLLIEESIYESFLNRLRDAVESLEIGPPKNAGTGMGPVIDEEAQTRLLSFLAETEGEAEGETGSHLKSGKGAGLNAGLRAELRAELFFKGSVPENGFYVPPTLFKDVDKQHPLWTQELFGPVLACRPFKTFDQAIAEANDCDYALTGGLFSRNPHHIKQALDAFEAGNLYINRNCTGALVGRQPFGGFKLSGIGSKAGGPDYLLQFMDPRTVTENTARKGFVPGG